MHLTEFRIFEAADSKAQVIIQLGKKENRTPLNFIRQAAKAVDRGVTVADIEGGANVAMCLLKLVEEAVLKSGWGASVTAIRSALLQLRQCASGAAKSANGTSVGAVQELLQGIEATLKVLGAFDAV